MSDSLPNRVVARAIAFGAAFALTLAICAGLAMWFMTRPSPPKRWNRAAFAVTFADINMSLGDQVSVYFFYTLENRTGRDYTLPDNSSLFLQLPSGKGLQRAENLKWKTAGIVPAGQRMNVAIAMVYDYSESFPKERPVDIAKFKSFMKRRIPEIDGFVVLDSVNRYQIAFPIPSNLVKE